MKQERIEELLKGTKYDPDTYKDTWGYSAYFKAGEVAWEDHQINAARVQLLAKALQRARPYVENAPLNGSIDVVEAIDVALAEAGLDKEPA